MSFFYLFRFFDWVTRICVCVHDSLDDFSCIVCSALHPSHLSTLTTFLLDSSGFGVWFGFFGSLLGALTVIHPCHT